MSRAIKIAEVAEAADTERRTKFVATYCNTGGSIASAAHSIDLTVHEGRNWVRAKWFKNGVVRFQQYLDEQMDLTITNLIDKSFKELEDRIDNGDETVFKGKVIRKKMTGKDLAVTAGVLFDKRTQIRKQPGEAEENDSLTRLERIADKLRGFKPATLDNEPVDVEMREILDEPSADDTDGAPDEPSTDDTDGAPDEPSTDDTEGTPDEPSADDNGDLV